MIFLCRCLLYGTYVRTVYSMLYRIIQPVVVCCLFVLFVLFYCAVVLLYTLYSI